MRGTTTGLRNRHLDVSVSGVGAHPGAAERAVRAQLTQINDLRDFEQFTRPNKTRIDDRFPIQINQSDDSSL